MGNVLEMVLDDCRESLTSTERTALRGLIYVYVERRREFAASLSIFLDYYPMWARTRQKTIEKVLDTAEYLHKLENDVNISNLTGSSAAILGGAMAFIGLVAAPATAGLSLGLTVGGSTLGTLGGLTASGSTLVKWGLTKAEITEVVRALKKDYQVTEGLKHILPLLQKNLEDLQEIASKLESLADRYGMLKLLIEKIYENCKKGAMAIDKVILPASIWGFNWIRSQSVGPMVRSIGATMTAISVLINGINIITTSIDVHEGSKSQVAKQLEEVAEKLQYEAKQMKQLVDNVHDLGL